MIPSAVNLPLSGLSGALHLEGEKFRETYGFKKPALDQEIVFYCRSGMRSASASDVARRNGFKKYMCSPTISQLILISFPPSVFSYKGSWLDWKAREGGQSL